MKHILLSTNLLDVLYSSMSTLALLHSSLPLKTINNHLNNLILFIFIK